MFKPEPNSLVNKIRFFITTRFSALASKVGFSQKQLIICGFPRSGTSLLYNMFSATLATKFKFTNFEHYFMHNIHKQGNIASKAPLDIMHLQYLDSLNIHNKTLFLVIVIRDIRDILVSRHPNVPNEYFIGWDHSYWHSPTSKITWSYVAPGIIDIAKKITEARQREDILVVKYEDMVSDPNHLQQIIKEKAGYTFSMKFSDYYKAQDKLAYQYKGRFEAKDKSLVLVGKKIEKKISKWKKSIYRDRLIEQFTECPALFDLLIDYGYEANNDWFDKLKKITNEPYKVHDKGTST